MENSEQNDSEMDRGHQLGTVFPEPKIMEMLDPIVADTLRSAEENGLVVLVINGFPRAYYEDKHDELDEDRRGTISVIHFDPSQAQFTRDVGYPEATEKLTGSLLHAINAYLEKLLAEINAQAGQK